MKEGKETLFVDGLKHRISGESFQYYSDSCNKWVSATIQPIHFDSKWKIVEEKKAWNNDSNLSSRIQYNDGRLEVESVKEANREFIKRIKDITDVGILKDNVLDDNATKIYGDKLC